jgi:hypothetical protein
VRTAHYLTLQVGTHQAAAPGTAEVELTTALTEGAGALAGSSTKNATLPGEVSATLKATAEAPAETRLGVPLEKAGGPLCVAAWPARSSRQAATGSHRRGVRPSMLCHVWH